MIVLFAGLAHADAPPSVDLDDVFGWEAAADALLDGPPGCHQVRGRVEQKLVGFAPPDLIQNGTQIEEVAHATLSGRLDEGLWQDFTITRDASGPDALRKSLPMFRRLFSERMDISPLIGRASRGGGPSNLVRTIIEEWGGDQSTAYVEWDDEAQGLWLRRQVPIRKKANAPTSQLDTFFPGGARTPSRTDIVFPETFRAGLKGLRMRIEDAQIHLRSAEMPTIESVSLLLTTMGVTLGYEQTIRYASFVPCALAEADGAPTSPPGPLDPPS